jgi:hypothetical protein
MKLFLYGYWRDFWLPEGTQSSHLPHTYLILQIALVHLNGRFSEWYGNRCFLYHSDKDGITSHADFFAFSYKPLYHLLFCSGRRHLSHIWPISNFSAMLVGFTGLNASLESCINGEMPLRAKCFCYHIVVIV